MGVVKRKGKWRLEKKKEGVYLITERKEPRAKLITDDYEAEGLNDERNDLSKQIIEVGDASEAEKILKEFAEGKRGGLL